MSLRSDEQGTCENRAAALPVSLEPTWQRLAELAGLEPDWDSYGADPPTESAIAAARRVVEAVAERLGSAGGAKAAPYFVAPIPSGGVQLEWCGANGELEVEVGPDGTLGYLLVKDDGDDQTPEEGRNIAWPQLIDRVVG